MKEPEIVQAINNLDGISEEEKKGYIELIKKTFYYNPDDYYKFAGILSALGITDTNEFFSNLRSYLDVRATIEERVAALTSKNNAARINLNNMENTCKKLKQKHDELRRVQDIVREIMVTLSGDEAKELIRLREEAFAGIKVVDEKVSAVKEKDAAFKEKMKAQGGIIPRIKSALKSRKAKGKIERLENSTYEARRSYDNRCNAVVRLFNTTVSDMPKDQAELLVKYKDLGGFENFFAIKYDFNWYLHKGMIGRLNDWLSALKMSEDETRETLMEEMDLTASLREKIIAREDFLRHYMEHLDMFHIDSDKRKIFEDYTKRYPNLSEFSTDELGDLDEQSDARLLYPTIVRTRGKVKTLKREDKAR